ncbi:MAG: hypothetical protein HND27_04895 [Bacteroidetes bacterium]|nr:hypothetical protein [Bacteroidota bacterium]NOG95097.1 hypothetical protein [Bacteroidota bacterium]
MKALIILCGTLIFVACHSKRNINQTDVSAENIFFTLERTPCYGTCENYKLIIYSNGYCIYEGKNFVEKIGKYESVMDAGRMELIKKKATEINYFSLENSYNHPGITDIPATITELYFNGKNKRIENRYQAPQKLKDFELFVESIINELPWKKSKE